MASERVTVAVQVVLPRCSPELILLPLLFLWLALLPGPPAAVPVVRSGIPASPTNGRTAGDAVCDQQLQVFDFRVARSELFLMREDLLTQRQDECL